MAREKVKVMVITTVRGNYITRLRCQIKFRMKSRTGFRIALSLRLGLSLGLG
jgi:hypothetical protein